MQKLITTSGKEFKINWAAPVSITENIVFLTSIIDGDIDEIHNTFKNSEETAVLTKVLEETIIEDSDSESQEDMVSVTTLDQYNNYTRYYGYEIKDDGSVIVTLKKQL